MITFKMKRKAGEMAEDSDNPSLPKVLEIDSDGDVLFKIGKGEAARDFKVLGSLICRASPVFATMLSSSFIEGNTRVVTVDDGDVEVYRDFFNIIHYKATEVDTIGGRRLALLAELADMRCCIEIFKPFIVDRLFWVIHEVTRACDDPTGTNSVNDILKQYHITFEELLNIAAFCKMNDLFWTTSKVAVAQSPGPLKPPIAKGWYIRCAYISIPVSREKAERKLDHVNKARKSSTTSFLNSVFQCIARDFSHASTGGKLQRCRDRYGAFVFLLAKEGIEAHKIAEYKGTLFDAIGVVRRFAGPEIAGKDAKSTLGAIARVLDPGSSHTGYLARDINGELLRLIDIHTKQLCGICLGCWNSGLSEEPYWESATERCDFGRPMS